MSVIVSDIDGVLASFESAWNPLLTKLAGTDKLPAGWNKDPNFPAIWDWDKEAYGQAIVRQGWDEIAKSPKFWKGLHSMPGAEDSCRRLNALQRKGHQVYFLTSRMGLAVQRQTQKWLYDRGVDYPAVIIVNKWEDKAGFLRSLKPHFFIDDKLETMNDLMNTVWRERWDMKGRFYLLKDAPYNRDGRIKGLSVTNSLESGLNEAGLVI